MKYILILLFLFNIFLIVSSRYDVFKIQASGCENYTLNLNECGRFNEINRVADGEVSYSTLNSKFNSFKFVKGPCVDDKNVTIGVCSTVCGTNIKINYNPFQNYTISTYTSKDCTGIGSTESYGSFYCKNGLISKAKNNQYLSCSESNSSTSSKFISIYNIILLDSIGECNSFGGKYSIGRNSNSNSNKIDCKSIGITTSHRFNCISNHEYTDSRIS
ncbi:hypothetical protein ACTFIR_009929 [Dictyostelium discoideum]